MAVKIVCATTIGIGAHLVRAEVDLAPGLPGLHLVGLGDKAVEESRERINSALKNSGLKPPSSFHKKVVVNLAPADLKKEGSGFDLPIALGFLCATEQVSRERLERLCVMGELGLDGSVRGVHGVAPILMALDSTRARTAIVIPADNYAEASFFAKTLAIIPVKTIAELVAYCDSGTVPNLPKVAPALPSVPEIDFSAISGLQNAKRALCIAAAGGHHLLFRGSPGTGKTILAKALPSILPPLSEPEAREVTAIYSVSGMLSPERPWIIERPFRQPHHSASASAIIGGGTNPRPGEISLAHRGVLFLDEFPEFRRDVIEALRQPLEEGTITVLRAKHNLSLPARFMLIAAMNPCPCGFYGDPQRSCSCSLQNIRTYQRKISGPILDRIDIAVSVPRIPLEQLLRKPLTNETEVVKRRVVSARAVQAQRFVSTKARTNADMNVSLIRQWCALEPSSELLLKQAAQQFALSPRAIHRTLRVARTIADLDASIAIHTQHLAEALQYRDTNGEV